MHAFATGVTKNVASLREGKMASFDGASYSAVVSRDISDKTMRVQLQNSPLKFAEVTLPANEELFTAQSADLFVETLVYEEASIDYDGYRPLIVDVNVFKGRESRGKLYLEKFPVANLASPITIAVPFNKRHLDADLVCAYFDEEQVEWTALNCPNEGSPSSSEAAEGPV